jgi:hypothetical protein
MMAAQALFNRLDADEQEALRFLFRKLSGIEGQAARLQPAPA